MHPSICINTRSTYTSTSDTPAYEDKLALTDFFDPANPKAVSTLVAELLCTFTQMDTDEVELLLRQHHYLQQRRFKAYVDRSRESKPKPLSGIMRQLNQSNLVLSMQTDALIEKFRLCVHNPDKYSSPAYTLLYDHLIDLLSAFIKMAQIYNCSKT
jgi:hypothetical protein